MIGSILNKRYRLEAQLGQGGMGVVYRAHDTLLDRLVAIKLLTDNSRARQGSQGRARLLHEAKSVARLNHRNIVSIYDAGDAGGLPYVVMELIEGKSLFEHRPTSISEIIDIAVQITSALQHAHTHGIIHRDLKPENIIVTQGVAKLTDFGLARSATSRLSTDNLIIGTVLYLPPEVALGQEVDARSDLYSFGVILYELLTGSLPFQADEPLAVISQHLHAPVPPPHAHRPDLPLALETLILRLLEKEPEARPNSALEVQQTLETILAAQTGLGAQPFSSKPEEANPSLLLDRIVRGRLIGREREVAEMRASLHQAFSGQGSVLLLSGESGIGKTRLARELLTQAAISGARILSGACYSEGGVPYAPFPQLIIDSFQLADAPFDLSSFALADLLAIAPELRQRFSDLSSIPNFDTYSEQQRIFESVTSWGAAIASKSPLLIFIDDIHWADSSTLFLIRHLARRLDNRPFIFLLTYREVELHEASPLQNVLHDLNRERLSTRIKLSRFDRSQTQNMLSAMLLPSGEIDPTLVDAIHRETEGNPFFIEEVTKTLLEEGKLCFEDICWKAENETEIEIPHSVRITIQNRLTRLPDQAQEALRMAAIIGRRFEFEVLSKVSDLDEDTLIEALETAERAQIVSEVTQGRGSPTLFSFAHALIPTTLRDSVSSLRRQRLHRRVALAIEDVYPESESHLETLAYHFENAGDAEKAEAYYRLAADRALSVYANQEAARYYRLALEMEPTGTEHANLLKGLGEALFRMSLYQEAKQAWLEAIDLYRQARAHGEMAYLYARAGRAAWYDNDTPGSLTICQEGLAAVEALGIPPEQVETPGLAALLHETARAYRFNNLFSESLPLCQQALQMAERLGLVEVQSEALATMGIMFDQPVEMRMESLQKAVELAESAGLLYTATRANVNLAGHYRDLMQFTEARRRMKRAVELAHCMGNNTWQHSFLSNIVDVSLDMGDFKTAEQDLEDMRKLQVGIPREGDAKALTCYFQAKLQRYLGNLQESMLLLNDCVMKEIDARKHSLEAAYHVLLADILQEQGLLEEAEEHLDQSLQIKVPLSPEGQFPQRMMQAAIAAKQGRFSEAKAWLEEARKIQEAALPGRRERFLLNLFGGEVFHSEGLYDQAAAAFEEAAAQSIQWGLKWYHPRILVKWAKTLLSRQEPGDKQQARQLLEQAQAIYKELDIPVYLAEIEDFIAKLDIMEP
jgi:eukaryotic-like serine/threonine-protein kinase